MQKNPRTRARHAAARDGAAARAAIFALWAFTLIGLAGHVLLIAAPSLGTWLPHRALLRELGPTVFARGQILLSLFALTLVLGAPRAWAGGFLSVILLGFAAEFVGVRTGFPFGRYEFTDLLGPKILGVVPILMPLAWFNITASAHALASSGSGHRTWKGLLVGSWLMLAWDLSIDPCLGHLYTAWRWESPGAYYGIPFSNFVGWFAVGILAMAVLDRTAGAWAPRKLLIPYYAANLAMSIGIAALSGMGAAAVASAAAAGVGLLFANGTRVRSIPPRTHPDAG